MSEYSLSDYSLSLTPKDVARKNKQIQNPDGSVSTERGITIGVDGGFINIPSIVSGVQLTPEEAYQVFLKSGIKPIVYKTEQEAVINSMKRSKEIGKELERLNLGVVPGY